MSSDTAISPQKQFEEKIVDRLRNDIGDLIPDEMLSGLVSGSIEKIFFEGEEYGDSWNRKKRPSIFEVTVKELMESRVSDQVDKWLDENIDKIDGLVQDAIKGGISRMVLSHFDMKFSSALMSVQNTLMEQFPVQS